QEQAPQIPEYARLSEALKDYIEIAENGGWTAIETGGVIEPGQVDKRIPQIRERLQLLGRVDGQNTMFDRLRDRFASMTDKASEKAVKQVSKADKEAAKENPEWVYNEDLEPVIREFQERRGSKIDGIIGPKTIAELNKPVEERVAQIKMAMEQWRWLPKDLGNKYVFVNTAGYYAKGVENGEVKVNTPIIVGQVAHPTPSFSSYIPNVKFYPDWTVPTSIAQRYLLDKVRNNPSVVSTLGYELYEDGTRVPLNATTIGRLSEASFPPYRFRQKPGSENALGLVRFSVENDYAIYLHDTPKDSLFEETNRNFSSGCVRVGQPVQMAQFLLVGNSKLSAGEVASMLDVAGRSDLKTNIVPLENKVPVHIMYMTAWVDDNNNIRFENDAYSRDAKLKAAMGI
ncbi:MAG: L,D-transpeptidase family protein, partial [Alphaproteobacteria bacterium]|nr:L,D-transpeptidase family protein [Alphaproteobacteria bacterium]